MSKGERGDSAPHLFVHTTTKPITTTITITYGQYFQHK